ncbi:MAG TPA: Gfo/Idh/MocA family oxidoreductase [Clostridiales bacterium]|nr:MAG: 1,5-anhydro-D-fructose reductase [Firmicutes bacterium ADurb.Bin262]HOU10143.1 Gfo/Idh/MocA family oxidoreductase [Clostridiales bacterium]HQK72813.1 Gfo/Idh/MocA family oxidoreductase [Clostridiales bacterium]
MIRVAMLGKWHVHAEGYAKQVKAYPAQISCVWDDEPVRGEKWARELEADFEPDLDRLLARTDVDAVVCCCATSLHAEVIIKAARAGKHIFTEKALAPTVAECDEIAKAVEESGVKFLISMPWRCRGDVRYAKKAIEDGLLGDLASIRIRNAHNGATANWLPDYWYDEKTAGGGAMMDLGCHPMYEAAYFCGRPARVVSVFNTLTGRAVDDNAVSVIEFQNKCIAVLETALVSHRSPSSIELYGTEGCLLINEGRVRITSLNLDDDNGSFIEVETFPEALPEPITMFLDACVKNTPVEFGLREARDLTELLEKAYIAHRTGAAAKFA